MNKIRNIAGMVLVATSFLACTKDAVESPSFDVKVERTQYKVGDSVRFNFSGNADIVTFYSGEKGKQYAFKDRIEASGKLELDMETQVVFGSQTNNLSFLVSTDFNNIYNTQNVQAATWTDITNRFTLSTSATPSANGTRTPSGKVDLSDLVVPGKPLYFAYKYVGQPSTPTTQRTWRVYAFNLTNTLADQSVLNVASVTTAGWLSVDFANPANKWTIQSASPSLYFAPNGSTIASEDWAITKALYPNTVSPDVGEAIKTFLDTPKASYSYKYSTPGTYKVTFVANNASFEGQKTVVKELEITVTN